jgi:hypothetical protein
MWEPRRLTTLWNSAASYSNNFTFTPLMGLLLSAVYCVSIRRVLFLCYLFAGYLSYSSTMKMEAVCSSKTTMNSYRSTRYYIPIHSTLLCYIVLKRPGFSLLFKVSHVLCFLQDVLPYISYALSVGVTSTARQMKPPETVNTIRVEEKRYDK